MEKDKVRCPLPATPTLFSAYSQQALGIFCIVKDIPVRNMDQTQVSTIRKIAAAFVVCMVVATIVVASASAKKKSTDVAVARVATQTVQAAPATQPAPAASASGTVAGATTSVYKDGSYTTTVVYDSPAGGQAITVHITLKGDIVTATSTQAGATDGDSREYQDSFIAGYKQLVVGRRITGIHLSRVSGASLTSQGFNDALRKIETEAKA